MKRCTAVACVALLSGCAGPWVSVTDASPRRVEFLVQNAWLAPMQDVDEQAAIHCGQYGLSYRQTGTVWIGPMLKRVAYECSQTEPPLMRKPEVRRTPAAAAHRVGAKPALVGAKVAAWTKAKTAINAWTQCLRIDAERKATETTDAPQSVAQKVVDACSTLEQAVHKPLEAAGEDSSGFQADLHAQAVQKAWNTVKGVRLNTGVPVSELPAF